MTPESNVALHWTRPCIACLENLRGYGLTVASESGDS